MKVLRVEELQVGAELIDPVTLRAWMDEHRLGEGEIHGITRLGGGTQNVLVSFQRGGRDYVLRRTPLHPRATSNESLRREATAIEALAGTDVPVPRLLAQCLDESVLGAFFYVMERVHGFNPTVEVPARHATEATMRHRMGLAAVEVLAAKAALDYEAIGLSGLGSPAGFLDRQVSRWLTELESYASLTGYPGPQLVGLERIAEWLEHNRPDDFAPGVMHGDFHLANLMYARDSAEIVAVVDWEMVTIGDPLLDLGWLLATWPDHHDQSTAGALGVPGDLPSRSELAGHYGFVTGRDVSAMLPWYTTLACFKLGILLEGTYARSCAGKAPAALGEQMRHLAGVLFIRAAEFMESEVPV